MYIDTILEYILFFLFNTHLYCLAGCLSMLVWTDAVLGVLYACVLFFYICICSAQLSMFHTERHPRNTLIIIIIVAECSAQTVPLQRFSVTATRAGQVFTVADNKSVSSSSVYTLSCVKFSKCGVLNAVKRLFLLIPKTFHNNWYLKQHECGLIWV